MTKQLAGYRVHRSRFAHSSRVGMRTIKFPLKPEKNKDLIESIKHDYVEAFGPLQIIDYVENKNYSLIDFYMDSLRAGVVLFHSDAKCRDFVDSLTDVQKGNDKKQKDRMRRKNPKFYGAVNYDIFKKEFILTGSKRKTSTENSVINAFIRCLKEDASKKIAEKYGKSLYKTIKEDGDQAEFLKNNFGVDRGIFTIENAGKTSSYLLPQLKFEKDLPIEDCFQRIDDLLQELNENKSVEELVGVSDNAGGLSQYFNTTITNLQKGNVEGMADNLLSLSDLWKGKRSELINRLKFLSRQAKKIKEPRMVSNWHEYRSNIGGKIQSYLSNCLRQNEEIKNQLFGYEDEGKTYDGHEQEIAKAKELITKHEPDRRK